MYMHTGIHLNLGYYFGRGGAAHLSYLFSKKVITTLLMGSPVSNDILLYERETAYFTLPPSYPPPQLYARMETSD